MWTAACQASLSFPISWSFLKFISIEWVRPSNHLILCHPSLLLPFIFSHVRVFSNESALCIRWPKCWSSRWAATERQSMWSHAVLTPDNEPGQRPLLPTHSPATITAEPRDICRDPGGKIQKGTESYSGASDTETHANTKPQVPGASHGLYP